MAMQKEIVKIKKILDKLVVVDCNNSINSALKFDPQAFGEILGGEISTVTKFPKGQVPLDMDFQLGQTFKNKVKDGQMTLKDIKSIVRSHISNIIGKKFMNPDLEKQMFDKICPAAIEILKDQ